MDCRAHSSASSCRRHAVFEAPLQSVWINQKTLAPLPLIIANGIDKRLGILVRGIKKILIFFLDL